MKVAITSFLFIFIYNFTVTNGIEKFISPYWELYKRNKFFTKIKLLPDPIFVPDGNAYLYPPYVKTKEDKIAYHLPTYYQSWNKITPTYDANNPFRAITLPTTTTKPTTTTTTPHPQKNPDSSSLNKVKQPFYDLYGYGEDDEYYDYFYY